MPYNTSIYPTQHSPPFFPRRPPTSLLSPIHLILEAITVDLLEVLPLVDAYAWGEYTRPDEVETQLGGIGVDPIDGSCYGAKCVGPLTRVRSLVVADAGRGRRELFLPTKTAIVRVLSSFLPATHALLP